MTGLLIFLWLIKVKKIYFKKMYNLSNSKYLNYNILKRSNVKLELFTRYAQFVFHFLFCCYILIFKKLVKINN